VEETLSTRGESRKCIIRRKAAAGNRNDTPALNRDAPYGDETVRHARVQARRDAKHCFSLLNAQTNVAGPSDEPFLGERPTKDRLWQVTVIIMTGHQSRA